MVGSYLSHARCWLSFLIGYQPWSIYMYITFDVISVKYNEKKTPLMASQWRSRPPSAFLTAAMRSSNTVFIRWFRSDTWGILDFKAAETFPNLLPRIREFIHTKHRNTRLGLRPRVVLRRCVRIKSRIRGSKRGVNNHLTLLWWCNHPSLL